MGSRGVSAGGGSGGSVPLEARRLKASQSAYFGPRTTAATMAPRRNDESMTAILRRSRSIEEVRAALMAANTSRTGNGSRRRQRVRSGTFSGVFPMEDGGADEYSSSGGGGRGGRGDADDDDDSGSSSVGDMSEFVSGLTRSKSQTLNTLRSFRSAADDGHGFSFLLSGMSRGSRRGADETDILDDTGEIGTAPATPTSVANLLSDLDAMSSRLASTTNRTTEVRRRSSKLGRRAKTLRRGEGGGASGNRSVADVAEAAAGRRRARKMSRPHSTLRRKEIARLVGDIDASKAKAAAESAMAEMAEMDPPPSDSPPRPLGSTTKLSKSTPFLVEALAAAKGGSSNGGGGSGGKKKKKERKKILAAVRKWRMAVSESKGATDATMFDIVLEARRLYRVVRDDCVKVMSAYAGAVEEVDWTQEFYGRLSAFGEEVDDGAHIAFPSDGAVARRLTDMEEAVINAALDERQTLIKAFEEKIRRYIEAKKLVNMLAKSVDGSGGAAVDEWTVRQYSMHVGNLHYATLTLFEAFIGLLAWMREFMGESTRDLDRVAIRSLLERNKRLVVSLGAGGGSGSGGGSGGR